MKTSIEYSLALRMRSATRWVEGQQGLLPDGGDGAIDGFGRAMLVRTGLLPSIYTGAEGVAGTTVDQQPSGDNVAGVAVLIKDLNGGKLAANTTYSARLGGYLTDKALYFVVAPASGSAVSASCRVCEYRPTGNQNPQGPITVYDISSNVPTNLSFNPLGLYCNLLLYFNVFPKVLVLSDGSATVIPFTFWGRCAGYVPATAFTDFAWILPPTSDQVTLSVLDPCGFARSSYERYGKFPRMAISWDPYGDTGGYSTLNPYVVIGAPPPQPMQTTFHPPINFSTPPAAPSTTLGAPLGAPLGG